MKIKGTLLTIIITVGLFCGNSIITEGHEHEDNVLKDGNYKVGAIHNVSTIKAEIVPFPPYHAAGNDVPTILRLTDAKGNPVKLEDLEVAHTRQVHLLIIDESMTDYYHEHPEPTNKPGEFRFIFKPKYGGRYYVWADLVPKNTGKQEYSKTEIKVDGKPKPFIETANTMVTVDGYRFDLSVENKEELKVGQPAMLIVKITKPNGEPANNLEPVMGAFAHAVGFTRDLNSVVHIHPMGREPERESERGGPELSFHVVPEKPGWMKLYVQVQSNGYSKFAGFGLNVSP